LGPENTEKFLDLHHAIADTIQQLSEQLKRLLTLEMNQAWYFSGNRYIEIYQQLKREMRLLDFTDLEWKCYQLLQHADNAHWVQYKIDQRIDHILIDEFQDTNPTQWHLLSPILEEIAASPDQRPRSVFLVGDEKQSIYSFRRANPALQAQASLWLKDNLTAKATPLDFSRRSSNAIIQCVNHIFQQPDIQSVMTGFTPHGTHLNELPGKVQLTDLFQAEEDTDKEADAAGAEQLSPPIFRNPLLQPRDNNVRTLRHEEADYISRQILQLVSGTEKITENRCIRPIVFGDIMILMRNRTHIAIYEEALKKQGIPFIGSKKGGLLDNLEIQDLNCLLNILVTPYNNLALAQVLKSPVFSASDDDLITLARFQTEQSKKETHWYNRLLLLAGEDQKQLSRALQRAARLLPHWQQLAEHLPVHDCLDKIFSEGNIIKRYMAANRPEHRQRVAANCQRFLSLSLETDSGRYPSITRFLQRLNHLQNYSASPPEEPLEQSEESRVRLMTIHGSKGLEAPVVFLADCNSTASNKNAYASLVRWPASKSQPVNFQLQLSKEYTDQMTQQLQQEKLHEQQREELNLLYVALTRAREQLYISGVASSRSREKSWYQIISDGITDVTQRAESIDGVNCNIYSFRDYPPANLDHRVNNNKNTEIPVGNLSDIDQRLLKPIPRVTPSRFLIAPSQSNEYGFIVEDKKADQTSGYGANDSSYQQGIAKWRGITIHRVIERLCNNRTYPATETSIQQIQNEIVEETSLNNPAFFADVSECVLEAVTTYHHADFEDLFNPGPGCQSYNEMPLMYIQTQGAVYGIVDRVIIEKESKTITVLDYKSHRLNAGESVNDSALPFTPQLKHYRSGINKLWPQHAIKIGVLFTYTNEIAWLEAE
ncbi:MAG: 3'-5' exonuclease, partial [Gammaproteobacteria bacterium]|nr:3'-5' exonuclease [Gammaproteobacteria bacterium]